MTILAGGLAVVVLGLTAHTVVNRRWWRRLSAVDDPGSVAVLLPVRDEADTIGACLTAVLAQTGVPALEVVVLDDGSTDSTVDIVRAVAGDDPRVRLVRGAPVPAGWLGKPHACAQLAQLTRADALVFVDADVVLAPTAVATTVAGLRRFDLVSPYPRLLAGTPGERLVQPLLAWLILTFLPLPALWRSPRPSLAAAGGQLLAVTRAAYERCGGHAGVRTEVLEDVALARAVKRSGGRITVTDGSGVASCRMYRTWSALAAGYRKSLWAAGGGPVGSLALAALLVLLYVVPVALAGIGLATADPPTVALAGVAYGAGVAGRVVTAAATGGRRWPDPLAHPVSVLVLAGLTVASVRAHARGELTWKGRRL